jgi:protein phosphatase
MRKLSGFFGSSRVDSTDSGQESGGLELRQEFQASGLSDSGRSREHNEDGYRIREKLGLFLVADGMGGHGNGEVASKLALESVDLELDGRLAAATDGSLGPEESGPGALVGAVEAANGAVVRAAERDPSLTGMGTTLAALLLQAGRVWIAHVGDSRVYRLRQQRLELMTNDHSWVGEQVTAGYLSDEQARVHPLRNVVTRALGGGPRVEVDVCDAEPRQGDRYLLCTDGLTGMLEDHEIQAHLVAGDPPEETCQRLVEAANDKGGLDNITVVLLDLL